MASVNHNKKIYVLDAETWVSMEMEVHVYHHVSRTAVAQC